MQTAIAFSSEAGDSSAATWLSIRLTGIKCPAGAHARGDQVLGAGEMHEDDRVGGVGAIWSR
ncbi:hypothetical protein C770_GR4pA050 (plasmid) [Sinorhizobium meliloti GR4]|nr:hypothetical protein C770_GR4pA050 [Sinorhizobium meliloti GR4]